MPKKDFKKVTDDNPALAFLSTSPSVQSAQHKDSVHDIHDKGAVQDEDGVHDKYNIQTVQSAQHKDSVHDIYDKDNVQPVHTADKTTVKYCNINLRLRQDLKDYLGDESWRTRTTMTQYISNLIEADMRAKQESAGENNV